MFTKDVLHELIGQIYDASVDPRLWPEFLTGLARRLGGTGTILFSLDSRDGSLKFGAVGGLDPEDLRVYDEYYLSIDVRRQNHWKVPAGQVHTDAQLISREEYFKSEIYNDFFSKAGAHHVVGAYLDKDPRRTSGLFVQMTRAPDDVPEGFELLLPHVRRALTIQSKMSRAHGVMDSVLELADRMTGGVIVVSGEGRILHANRRARCFLEEQDGLRAGPGGRLAASHAGESRRLRELLEGAGKTTRGLELRGGGTLSLSRPSGHRPLTLLVSPLPHQKYLLDKERPAAILLIRDPEERVLISQDQLQRFFGLTPAEGRLAALLTTGRSLSEIAGRLQVTANTARNQLKSIFSKTGTHRQGELIQLLLSSSFGLQLK